MRDAIGQVFALQVILAFVLLINGYMAYSVNYARAFRVKNQIVNIIEQIKIRRQAPIGSPHCLIKVSLERAFKSDDERFIKMSPI